MAASYSEQDKAVAIEIVERFGGEISRECLETIRKALAAPGLNKSTVYRWWVARPVATGLHSQKIAVRVDQALDEMFEATARTMLVRAVEDDVVDKMAGRDLVMGAAIAVDKMRLLRNLPTEIISVLPELLMAFESHGLSAADVFSAMLAELHAKADYERLNR